MIAARHDFANRQELAATLAVNVARALSHAITAQGRAVLAVSGGTTPSLFFEHLSQQPITWEKVTVTLVDEREVPDGHPRSNARLVKAALMINHAAEATFVPLYKNHKRASLLVPACVVLGMGEDGHTASFFPGGDQLSLALDPSSAKGLVSMQAETAGEPRVTFTLSRLLMARAIFLHIEGAKKLAVLKRAESGRDIMHMPIRAFLKSSRPLDVFWCP